MKKTLTVLLALVLVIAMSVAGTMAYLTSSDEVVNTFTVGNVKITLDEADVDNSTDGKDRDQANSYKLIPGHEYAKDPIVHVDANSENCWLFVQVDNQIAAIEDADKSVASQMANNDWTVVDATNNVYAYKDIVSANANVPVFTTFTVAGTVDNTTLATYNNKTIVVTAYAVQADGFATAALAWSNTFGAPSPPPPPPRLPQLNKAQPYLK